MKIKLLADALFYSYKLILSVYSTVTNTLTLISEVPYDFDILIEYTPLNVDWIYDCCENKVTKIFSDNSEFLWIGIPIDNTVYLIGPVSTIGLSRSQITSTLSAQKIDPHKISTLTDIYAQTPVLPYLELLRLTNLLQYVLSNGSAPLLPVTSQVKEHNLILKYNDDESYFTQERNFIISQKVEKMLKEYISNGKVDQLKNLNSYLVPKTGHLSRNSIRQAQNSFIVLMTLAGRAAIDGGLPVEIAHPLCDKYALQCELLNSEIEIRELQSRLVIDLTEKVYYYKQNNPNKYSRLVNNCCGYILANQNSPLKLQDVATHFQVNAENLSRKFRKETGISINRYIQNAKIEAAKELLQNTSMTLSAISAKLGFSSQSQFTIVFKKITGITPGHYREGI